MSASPTPSLTISATDWLLLILLSVLWGGAFYFAKVAVLEIPTLTLGFGRVAIAAAALLMRMPLLRTPLPRDRETWQILAVMAVFNNVLPFTLIVWGQIHIS